MCLGKDYLEECLAELQKIDKNEQTQKVKDTIRDMKIVQEMYARNIEFLPIDLYKAKADRFQIIDGKIMPGFSALSGMEDNASKRKGVKNNT